MSDFDVSTSVFGKWKIVQELGSGSFGTVYKIKKEEGGVESLSALKVIQIPQNKSEISGVKHELGDDASVREYYHSFATDFAKEIKMMSILKGHSNIVSFEDYDIISNEDGISWTILIRMELLTPFPDYQASHVITEQSVIQLGTDICKALELCEKHKIIHRDIKPDNIFVTDIGTFKLGDFGIARELEKTTGGLSKKGSYSYMAPEVYLGQDYDHTVDIYSLGIVLYKLLNKNRGPFLPFAPAPITYSDRESALEQRIKGIELPDIPEVSAQLNAVVKKACSFKASDRFQSAGELRAALEDCVNADKSAVVPETIPKKKRNPSLKTEPKQKTEPQPESEKTKKKPVKKIVIAAVSALLIFALISVILIVKHNKSNNNMPAVPVGQVTAGPMQKGTNKETTASSTTSSTEIPSTSIPAAVSAITGTDKQTTAAASTTDKQTPATTTPSTTNKQTPATTKNETEHQHVWSEWTPEDYEKRTHARTCKVCDLKEIELCSFDDSPDEYWEPSCTEDGFRRFTCHVCHGAYYENLSALGHVWSNWSFDDFTHTRHCERCGIFEECEHYDNNSDGYCDECGAPFGGDEEICDHYDDDDDGYCDNCGIEF